MAFTNKDVMDLRAKTGVGMMDCKRALEESDGDIEGAVDILREKGIATSAKRASKIASQGIVEAYVDGNVGVLVEVNCESDFVARGEQYRAYVLEIAKYIAKNDVTTVDEVKSAMENLTAETIAKIGEKIDIRRFEKFVGNNTKLDSYIHMGGKIGVIVEMSGNSSAEIIHDIALQIAASNPAYVKAEQVPASEVEKEKEILKVQALNEEKPKPLAIIEKMIDGRINKFYKEICLIEQPFVKDADKNVKDILKEANAEVFRFARLTMGEGLEKKCEDLGKEVAEQIAKAKK